MTLIGYTMMSEQTGRSSWCATSPSSSKPASFPR